MSLLQHKQTRGRPRGSAIPIEQRRKRKDYRLSPAALAHIEQGRTLTPSSETTFVEQAIAHYVAFLSNQVSQQVHENEEIEQLRMQVSDLEDELRETRALLRQSQMETKALKARPEERVAQPAKRYQPSYQILIRHELGMCPILPEEFHYRDWPKESASEQCPTHEIFSETCLIRHARGKLESLKSVRGLTRLWLSKNGYPLEHDAWEKERGQWIRDE